MTVHECYRHKLQIADHQVPVNMQHVLLFSDVLIFRTLIKRSLVRTSTEIMVKLKPLFILILIIAILDIFFEITSLGINISKIKKKGSTKKHLTEGRGDDTYSDDDPFGDDRNIGRRRDRNKWREDPEEVDPGLQLQFLYHPMVNSIFLNVMFTMVSLTIILACILSVMRRSVIFTAIMSALLGLWIILSLILSGLTGGSAGILGIFITMCNISLCITMIIFVVQLNRYRKSSEYLLKKNRSNNRSRIQGHPSQRSI